MTFPNVFSALAWRLAKSRATWIALAVLAALIALSVATLKALSADPRAAALVVETSSDAAFGLSAVASGGGVDLARACGALFVRGSAVSMLAAVFSGVFVAADLRGGAVKNVVQGRGGRLCYAASAFAVAALISALFTAVGTLASAVALTAAGFPPTAPDLPRLWCWAAEVAVSAWAYASVAVVAALLSGSAVVASVAGLLLGGAVAENLLYLALGALTGRPDEVRAVFDGYLAVTVSRLGDGSVLPAEAMVPAVATLLAAFAVGALALRRRRLA